MAEGDAMGGRRREQHRISEAPGHGKTIFKKGMETMSVSHVQGGGVEICGRGRLFSSFS